MRGGASEPAKRFLNARASEYLGARGHSDAMTREAKREAWWWLQARAAAAARRTRLRRGWTVVWPEPGRAELVPFETPEAGPGEVTVDLVFSAVSPGTELAQYLRLPDAPVRFPHRPGYAGSGVVAAVGSGVDHVAPGDRVAVRNTPHASVATVPAASVHRLPAGVPLDSAAFVQLGVISSQGVRLAAIRSGWRICVVGAGIVGALALRLAELAGGVSPVVVASSRRREAVARMLGAEEFVLADDRRALAEIAADVVIEATGDPDALEAALAAAGHNARVVLLGSPRGTTARFDVATIREKALHVIGAHVSTLDRSGEVDPWRRSAETFIEALAGGSLDLRPLVTVRADPREAALLYRGLARERRTVGALFDWSRMPADARRGRGRFLRLPDISGRGVDFDRDPLPARRRPAAPELRDPFEGASGLLRMALVGCGDIAFKNAAAVAAAPNAKLVACHDPEARLAQELATAHGVDAVPTLDRLLARRDVDGVVLCVPHDLHVPLALEAIEAGKHVLIEKPPASDLAGALSIRRAAAAAGVAVSFCFPHRYQARSVVAKRLIEEGVLGEITGVLATYFADKTDAYWSGGFSGRARSDWRLSRERAGGGVLIMNASHNVELVRHLVDDEAESVLAIAAAVDRAAEVEDSATVAVRYGAGALGTFIASSARRGTGAGAGDLDLWGRDGQISLYPTLRVYTERAVPGVRTGRWQSIPDLPPRHDRAVLVSRFATAVARGEQPDVTVEDGVAVQAFLEAAYRSSETGSAVSPAELLTLAAA